MCFIERERDIGSRSRRNKNGKMTAGLTVEMRNRRSFLPLLLLEDQGNTPAQLGDYELLVTVGQEQFSMGKFEDSHS